MYLQVSQTPSNTPSNTPSYTPSGTACPTPSPSVTPSITPTQSPYAYCPEEITLTWLNNQEAFSAATGTYYRVKTYTGGTFDYGWIDNNLPIDLNIGTSPDGNNYAVYERWVGATAYTLTNYYFLPTSTTRYYSVFRTIGSLINNQVTTNLGAAVITITGNTISGVYLPSQGQQIASGQDMYIAYPAICPTPSMTPSVTPTLTQTTTQTPSPTFCYQPKAYLVLDAASGSSAMNTWMASQGSTFRGLNGAGTPSTNSAIFEAQMNAYISYTGFGTTTFYIEDEPITSTSSLYHTAEQEWSGTFVWNSWFVPTCPFCDGGNWTRWNNNVLSSTQYSKVFYYSGTAIPQGYYRWLTTYTNTGMRTQSQPNHDLNTLVCPQTPTPSPTTTMTRTPTITPTMTQTPSVSPTMTQTPSQTATVTPSPTCGTYTTQYMEVILQSCHNFALKLFDNPDLTGNANAVCDVIVSGCAYGDQGTVYCGTETIAQNDHVHNFSLQPVLLPGECVSAFTVNSITEQCPCYEVIYVPNITPTPSPTTTMTQTPSPSVTNTPSQTGTPPVTPTSTINTTPSPTPSVTMTNSPTTTMTPTVTPTSAVTTCCVAEIRTDASLDITISGLEVSGVTMTYLSGDTLPIAPSDPPGYYGTFQTGTSVTVVVSYNPCIAGQNIILVDCNGVGQCCDLNPGGGNCTFTGVDLSCGCQFTITGYDGTCT